MRAALLILVVLGAASGPAAAGADACAGGADAGGSQAAGTFILPLPVACAGDLGPGDGRDVYLTLGNPPTQVEVCALGADVVGITGFLPGGSGPGFWQVRQVEAGTCLAWYVIDAPGIPGDVVVDLAPASAVAAGYTLRFLP